MGKHTTEGLHLDEDRLLTAREVMTILHASRSVLHRLIASGELPVKRIGRMLRFRPLEVLAYVNRPRVARKARKRYPKAPHAG